MIDCQIETNYNIFNKNMKTFTQLSCGGQATLMKKWLKSFSIHSIIFFSFLPLFLLIMATYGGFYLISSQQLKNQTYKSANNINSQISNSLGQTLDNVYLSTTEITSNWYFFQFKQNIERDIAPAISPSNYRRLYNLLEGLIISNPNYFNSISLFTDDRSILVYKSTPAEPVRNISFRYEDYSDTVSSQYLTWILPRDMHPYKLDSGNYSSLGLMMLLGDENSRLHGFILFEINDELLQKEIQNAIITPGSQFAIICQNQLLLDRSKTMEAAELDQFPAGIPEQFDVGDNCYFYTPVTSHAAELSLGILSRVPLAEISLNQKPLSQALFAIIACFLFFWALDYYMIHLTVSQPLIRLNRCLAKPYDITAPIEFNISGSREIHTITGTLNHFLGRIHMLVQNLNQEMDDRRIAELNVLYEQINPHFLYNALDTIYQLCDMEDIRNAKEITHSLAAFYRIGVSKGANYISLEEECTHAQVYLSIMQIRFEDFTYEIVLPEQLKSCITIKQILQPILENAIYHGIHLLDDRTGHICVVVSEETAGIKIEVTDNGIGLVEDDLANIRKGLAEPFHPSQKGKVYGLKNVHARIRLTYHSPYGIAVDSVTEQGTAVTIVIPKIIEKQEGKLENDEDTVC